VSVSWNGLDVLKAGVSGCWTLSIEKDPPTAILPLKCVLVDTVVDFEPQHVFDAATNYAALQQF